MFFMPNKDISGVVIERLVIVTRKSLVEELLLLKERGLSSPTLLVVSFSISPGQLRDMYASIFGAADADLIASYCFTVGGDGCRCFDEAFVRQVKAVYAERDPADRTLAATIQEARARAREEVYHVDELDPELSNISPYICPDIIDIHETLVHRGVPMEDEVIRSLLTEWLLTKRPRVTMVAVRGQHEKDRLADIVYNVVGCSLSNVFASYLIIGPGPDIRDEDKESLWRGIDGASQLLAPEQRTIARLTILAMKIGQLPC